MAMHHLGSGIWSQSFLMRGAIFTVTVPATTMTSAWRGDARTMVPIRSRSTRLAAAAMSSMAQQLVPIGKIHSEFVTPQVRSWSSTPTPTESPGACSMRW